jgi:prevent-host-death family protein
MDLDSLTLMTRNLAISETLSLSSVKAHLSELVDRVEDQHERVVVTRNGKPAAVLVSHDDLESLEETLAIMSDPNSRDSPLRSSKSSDAWPVHSRSPDGGAPPSARPADLPTGCDCHPRRSVGILGHEGGAQDPAASCSDRQMQSLALALIIGFAGLGGEHQP